MTAEDRLRGRLRSTASSMPVGAGSLAGVEARAAQLQRRRNAVRGGVGAFALVAVALVGVVSLRNGGIDEYTTSIAADAPAGAESGEAGSAGAADAASDPVQVGDGSAAADREALETDSDMAALAEESADEMSSPESESAADAESAPTSAADTSSGDSSDEATSPRQTDDSAGSLTGGADDAVESPSGESDDAAPPRVGEGGEDASNGGISETVEPFDDATPRSETDQSDGRPGSVAFASTVRAVTPPPGVKGGEVRYSFRNSRVLARAANDWFSYDGNRWHASTEPEAPGREPVARGADGSAAVVLDEAMMHDVVTSVEVSAGAAWLKHGDMTWEICPIPDADAAHGAIGWAGKHLAVIVGVPEQALYLLERID